MESITVHVQQVHIDEGRSGSCYSCPIASALHDMGHGRALVGGTYLLLDGGESGPPYDLPREAQTFISAFDANQHVEPFTFTATRE